MRILLVDDDSAYRKVLKMSIQSRGHEVFDVADGMEGMKVAEKEQVDALVSDILMPEMDGLHLCGEIRRSERGNIPIILYSAIFTDKIDERSAMAAGADLFLRKPFSNQSLLEALQDLRSTPRIQSAPVPGSALPALRRDQNLRFVRHLEQSLLALRAKTQALERSEVKFKTVVESVAAAIIIHLGGRILFVNSEAKNLTQYSEEELKRMSLSDIAPSARKALEAGSRRKTEAAGVRSRKETKIVTKHGEERWVILTSGVIEYEGALASLETAYDITDLKSSEDEQKTFQRQLARAQKMEGIGELAGGLAHDFNNILSIILGHVSILDKNRTNPQTFSASLDSINGAGARGSALVRQLISLSRSTEFEVEVLQVNSLLEEVLRFIREVFPKTIALEAQLNGSIPMIAANALQLHQVLLNLCMNARDAMPEGGTLLLSTDTLEGETLRTNFPEATEERYVLLKVRDTGTGMDEEVLQKIFKPFFTTKSSGEGSGLGLAMVHRIVKSHQGFIDVKSRVGVGTTIDVYLPAVRRVK